MKNFKQFIEEQKEVEIDGYKTKYHYMCPSAVKFFNKHDRMDHSEDEAKVEKSGEVSDEQVETAERLVKMVKDRVKDMGHDPEEVNYMDLHIDAIKNPAKAGSMKWKLSNNILMK